MTLHLAGIKDAIHEGPTGRRGLIRVAEAVRASSYSVFPALNGGPFMHSACPTTARDAVFFGPDTHKFADAINAWLANRKPSIRRAPDDAGYALHLLHSHTSQSHP